MKRRFLIMKKYGEFGGSYVPQELKERLDEIKEEFEKIKKSKEFKKEYLYYLKHFVGRPSPLYFAENLTKYAGGAKIFLKREDLNHTGAHKINNAIGQILLAKRMGKKRIIAETGAGQHGVATATVCSLFNIECIIFMGREDIKRQRVNVEKMKLLDEKTTVENLADIMQKAEVCPNIFSQSHQCKKDELACDCKTCWCEYIKRQLQPFPRLSFHEIVYHDSEKIEKVKSDEYKNWIYEYLSKNEYLSSENIAYFGSKEDNDYADLLHLFVMYIADLTDETDFENLANPEEFEAERYIFRIKDMTLEVCVIVGQGSVIVINKVDHQDDCLNI